MSDTTQTSHAALIAEVTALRATLNDAVELCETLRAERDRLHKQLVALTAERNSVCADYVSRVSELDKANAEIADYAIEHDRILGCVREAMTSAESLRRATGDAIPAAICHCLRAALGRSAP